MSAESTPHSAQDVREHVDWLLSDQNPYGVSADEELLCQMTLGLIEQLETVQARADELNQELSESQDRYERLKEQFERFRSAVECEFAADGRTQAEVDSIMAWLSAPMRQNG